MLGGLVIGFILGMAAGAGLVFYLRRTRPPAPDQAGATATAAGHQQPLAPASPPPQEPAQGPADEDIRRAIDASAGLLDELETRYRDRPRPAGDDDPVRTRRRPKR